MTERFRRREGMTLLELLVVISMISFLISLALPAVQQVRSAASRVSCANRLRQIGLGLHNYDAAFGHLPPGPRQGARGAPDADLGVSWLAHILPYVEQQGLWDLTEQAFRLNENPLVNPPHVGLGTVIPLYVCPADGRLVTPYRDKDGHTGAYTSYLAVSGGMTGENNGVLAERPGIPLTDVIDGTSHTIMVGERPPSANMDSGWWYTAHNSPDGLDYALPAESALDPLDPACTGHGIPQPNGTTEIKNVFGPGRVTNQCDRYHYWSLHPGGANFLFADGSIRFLSYSISPKLRALATRNGGEIVDDP